MRKINQIEPVISLSDKHAINKYLKSGGWITENKISKKFEKNFSKLVGTKYSILHPNGTLTLLSIMMALGLKKNDEIKLDYQNIGPNKLFYDVIYNPKQTKFLLNAKQFGNQIINGKMMFIYQAHQAFTIWHKIMPKIDDETTKLLD